MRRSLIVAATVALTVCASAQAQRSGAGSVRYRWHDAQGLAHYSDSLSAEALKYGYDLVNDQGLVIRHVERQLTTKEREAAGKAAAAEAARQRAVDEQKRNEQQMMAAYPTEAEFVANQKDQLDTIDQKVATTRVNLRSQEKALTDLLDRAGDLERAKQPVPKFLNDRIADQRNTVADQRALLDRLLSSYVTTQLKNEQELQRYRELKSRQQDDDASP